MQIGFGYDVHKLVKGRKLIVGGEEVPHSKGLLGDKAYKDISSLKLLASVKDLLKKKGYVISNIDSTIVAEEPRFGPYVEKMRKNIAETLGIEKGSVNVKATTEEGLGFTGSKEGISAYAVCLVHD